MTNKEIVLKFYEEVFNGWDMSVIDKYIKEDCSVVMGVIRRRRVRHLCAFIMSFKYN